VRVLERLGVRVAVEALRDSEHTAAQVGGRHVLQLYAGLVVAQPGAAPVQPDQSVQQVPVAELLGVFHRYFGLVLLDVLSDVKVSHVMHFFVYKLNFVADLGGGGLNFTAIFVIIFIFSGVQFGFILFLLFEKYVLLFFFRYFGWLVVFERLDSEAHPVAQRSNEILGDCILNQAVVSSQLVGGLVQLL